MMELENSGMTDMWLIKSLHHPVAGGSIFTESVQAIITGMKSLNIRRVSTGTSGIITPIYGIESAQPAIISGVGTSGGGI